MGRDGSIALFLGKRLVIAPHEFFVLGQVAFVERFLQRLADIGGKMPPDIIGDGPATGLFRRLLLRGIELVL